MAILMMTIFMKNSKNHIKGEFVKIQKFILVIILVIFPQKWQFRLKNENFENFSEFSLIMSHIFEHIR